MSAVEELAQATDIFLKREGSIEMRVSGLSMMPSIWPGSRVKITRCDESDIRKGDVVLFRGQNGLVLHRAIQHSTQGWLMRGDARSCVEGPVSSEQILGKMEDLCVGKWVVHGISTNAQYAVRRAWLPAIPWVRRIRRLMTLQRHKTH